MALLLKKGECFLHIPKAGGSWVSVILKEQGLVYKEIGYHKHIDWTRVAFFLNRTLDYYPKLILVLINFFSLKFLSALYGILSNGTNRGGSTVVKIR